MDGLSREAGVQISTNFSQPSFPHPFSHHFYHSLGPTGLVGSPASPAWRSSSSLELSQIVRDHPPVTPGQGSDLYQLENVCNIYLQNIFILAENVNYVGAGSLWKFFIRVGINKTNFTCSKSASSSLVVSSSPWIMVGSYLRSRFSSFL